MWSSEDLPCYLNLIQPRHLYTFGRPRVRKEGVRQPNPARSPLPSRSLTRHLHRPPRHAAAHPPRPTSPTCCSAPATDEGRDGPRSTPPDSARASLRSALSPSVAPYALQRSKITPPALPSPPKPIPRLTSHRAHRAHREPASGNPLRLSPCGGPHTERSRDARAPRLLSQRRAHRAF